MTGIKVLPDKTCLACNQPFNRIRMSGRLEDATAYRRRKFCSQSCANKRASTKKQTLLWRARKHRKAACEACGHTRRLQVHHCDQDQANNDPSNLQTLCKHCHDFWHATAKRLGRPVALRMPCLVSPKEWPLGWTDLRPLVTDKSPCVPPPLGECSPQLCEEAA